MKLKIDFALFFLCTLFITASAMGQVYGFEFMTSTPGFSGELFFNTPSGVEGVGLEGNSFITTPDGTFTVSNSVPGTPFFPPPPIAWSPDGITALNISLYESLDSQLYNWTATPTSIADTPVAAIPEIADPSASGNWVYVGVVPEPSAPLLAAVGVAAIFARRIRHKFPIGVFRFRLFQSRGERLQVAQRQSKSWDTLSNDGN